MSQHDILTTYEKLKSLVLTIEYDVNKAAGGNRAAGTRVRKSMQEVKAHGQQLRQQILDARKEDF